ncbi:MAG: hypothetical protein ACKOFF_07180 [Acidimicrobiales bacterium]
MSDGALQQAAQPGAVIVTTNAVLTAVFVVATAAAVVVFDQPWKAVSVAVDLACFALGVFAFLWGYWNAVQRSRTESIGVAQLYFLLGGIAPRTVWVRMNVLLAVQTVVGIGGALARGSTDGKPGSTLAFGILVPMLGLGLNGLWGAFHGTFPPRQGPEGPRVPPADGANGQD